MDLFAAFASAGLVVMVVGFAITLLLIISMWKIFTKAGHPGWKSIIPIYNIIIYLKIANLSGWYLLLMIIPFVNIYAIFKTSINLAKNFSKSTGFGVAMVFFTPICLPILAFSKNSVFIGSMSQNINAYQQPMNNGYGVQQPVQPAQPVNTTNPFITQQPVQNSPLEPTQPQPPFPPQFS